MKNLTLFQSSNKLADAVTEARMRADLRRFEQESRVRGDAKAPRPECGDCPAWQVKAGCGYLWAGTKCRRHGGQQ